MGPTNRLDHFLFRVVRAIVDRVCHTSGRSNYDVAAWVIGVCMFLGFVSCIILVTGALDGSPVRALLAARGGDGAWDILLAVLRLVWIAPGLSSIRLCRRLARSVHNSSGTMNMTGREVHNLWIQSFLFTVLGLVFASLLLVLWGVGHYAIRTHNGGGRSVLARARERVAAWARGFTLRPVPTPA